MSESLGYIILFEKSRLFGSFGTLVGLMVLAAKLPPSGKVRRMPLNAAIFYEKKRLFSMDTVLVHSGANNVAAFRQMLNNLKQTDF